MNKFYRYLIYKLYSKVSKNVSATPIANVILILSLTHFVELTIVYSIILRINPALMLTNKLYIGLFFIFFIFLNYYLFYNKEKWASYIDEFKNENSEESSKGTFFVFAYLIGTVLFLFILLALLFG